MTGDPKTGQEQEIDEVLENPIEELMAGDEEVVDLDTQSWDEQETWIDREPVDPRELPDEDLDEDEFAAQTEPSSGDAQWASIDRVLQILLACNLTLIGILLCLPGSSSPPSAAPSAAPPPAVAANPPPVQELTEQRPDPFTRSPRRSGDVPDDQLWEQAVRDAGAGDYARAARLLERYLERPMNDVERRLVYNQLSYYLVKDGRIQEAQDYERRSQQIMTRSYLPEDLLQSAHRAVQQGQLPEMRSAYARFLLQQRQLPPTLRKFVAEAYLKLGDSYRLEAEREADRAEDDANAEARAAANGHGEEEQR